MSDGFVYFIKEEETGRIKIGFSEKHPKGRLKEFQTGNSNKLILLGYIEGTYQDESNLHKEFSEERIRNENEWFESSPRLVNRIKELLEESLEDKKSGIEDLNPEYNEGENDDVIKDGLGKFTYSNGNIYEGEWKDGERNGQGTFTFGKGEWEGQKYVGEFKDGKYDGHGTYTWSNGEKYEGEYKDDEPNGQGTWSSNDGDVYEGEWKDGKRHGQGIETYSDGGKYVGEFKLGKRNGQGTYTSRTIRSNPEYSGLKFVGEWKRGMEWNGTGYNNYGKIQFKKVNGKIDTTITPTKTKWWKKYSW